MDSSTPAIFFRQFCELVVKHGYSLDMVLPLFTSSTARALKLEKKGCLKEGIDADVVVLSHDSLDVRTVIARGRFMVRDGEPIVREKWLEKSKREIVLVGDQFPANRPGPRQIAVDDVTAPPSPATSSSRSRSRRLR
jgi:adenine deaminase